MDLAVIEQLGNSFKELIYIFKIQTHYWNLALDYFPWPKTSAISISSGEMGNL